MCRKDWTAEVVIIAKTRKERKKRKEDSPLKGHTSRPKGEKCRPGEEN